MVMWFRKGLKRFKRDDSGAITVDFIVLTAAIVSLAVAVAQPIGITAEGEAIAMKKCMRVLGNQMSNDKRSLTQKFNRTQRGCAKF